MMRSTRKFSKLHGGVLALAAIAGCEDGSTGQTDLAKVPPPSQAVLDAAKIQAPQKGRPKFGSPPRSEMAKP